MFYVFIGLLNGIVVGTSRTVYGRLSSYVGPFNASVWAHVVGLAFLTLLILISGQPFYYPSNVAPLAAYLGGFFGALFVVVSSYVFPRLGAVKAALFVISGQMITAVIFDWIHSGESPSIVTSIGAILVVSAIYVSGMFRNRHLEAKS